MSSYIYVVMYTEWFWNISPYSGIMNLHDTLNERCHMDITCHMT